MIKFLLFSIFLLFTSKSDVEFISMSFEKMKLIISKENRFTIVYFLKPWCKPCVKNLPKLKVLNRDFNFNVVFLTTQNENVGILKKYEFDTCYYFDPLIYKTHTLDYDEYDQFTSEVFNYAQIEEPTNRVRFPAVFVFNSIGNLVYFNEDNNSTVIEFQKIVSLTH